MDNDDFYGWDDFTEDGRDTNPKPERIESYIRDVVLKKHKGNPSTIDWDEVILDMYVHFNYLDTSRVKKVIEKIKRKLN